MTGAKKDINPSKLVTSNQWDWCSGVSHSDKLITTWAIILIKGDFQADCEDCDPLLVSESSTQDQLVREYDIQLNISWSVKFCKTCRRVWLIQAEIKQHWIRIKQEIKEQPPHARLWAPFLQTSLPLTSPSTPTWWRWLSLSSAESSYDRF